MLNTMLEALKPVLEELSQDRALWGSCPTTRLILW